MTITGGSKGQEGAGLWKKPIIKHVEQERKFNFLTGHC